MELFCKTFLIVSCLLSVLSCTDDQPSKQDDQSKPIFESDSRIVDIGIGMGSTCVLDSLGHVGCWSNPQRFVPDQPGGTRGTYVSDYPERSGDDIKAKRYTNIYFGSDQKDVLCGLTPEGKVDCSVLGSLPSIDMVTDVHTIGKVKQVAIGFTVFCVITDSDKTLCYQISKFPTKDLEPQFLLDKAVLGGTMSCSIQNDKTLDCRNSLFFHKIVKAEDFTANISAMRLKVSKFGESRGHQSVSLGGEFTGCVTDSKSKEMHCFKSERNTKLSELSTSKFSQIETMPGGLCGISNHKLACAIENDERVSQSNAELFKIKFKQISVAFNTLCGIKDDDTVICWVPPSKGYPVGIPDNIKAP